MSGRLLPEMPGRQTPQIGVHKLDELRPGGIVASAEGLQFTGDGARQHT